MRVAQLVVQAVEEVRLVEVGGAFRRASAARVGTVPRGSRSWASRGSGSPPCSSGAGGCCCAGTRSPGRSTGCCPAGGVNAGESLVHALQRELAEEIGIVGDEDELPVEGPVAIVDSISPERSFAAKHVVHIIFAGDLDRPVAGGGDVEGRRRTRPPAVRPRRSWRGSSYTRRSSASSSDGARAILWSTWVPSGRPRSRTAGEASTQDRRGFVTDARALRR